MLDALEQTHPALVRNVVPKPLPVTLLAEVLRRLVEERVSVRNLREILEGLAPYAAQEKDPVVLAELARQALRREITHALAPGGRLHAWFLAPEVSEAVREAVVRTPTGSYLRLDPALAEEIRDAVSARVGVGPAVLVAEPDVRRFVWLLLEPRLPRLRVVSSGELAPGTVIQPLGAVGP